MFFTRCLMFFFAHWKALKKHAGSCAKIMLAAVVFGIRIFSQTVITPARTVCRCHGGLWM